MQITEKIKNSLMIDILNGRYAPGERIPTELETAGAFKASRVTVRRAYAQLEQAGIILRKKRSGTVVNDTFSGNTGEIRQVAIITTLNDQFSRIFFETIWEVARDRDAITILELAHEGSNEQSEAALRLAAGGVKNIVLWGFDHQLDLKLFERLRVLGVNLVFFDRIFPGSFADYVGLDNQHAIETIIKHAIWQKITSFVFVDASGLDVDSNRERRDCFISECKKNNLEFTIFSLPWFEINSPDTLRICNGFFDNYRQGQETAIVCVNDSIAMTVKRNSGKNRLIYSIDGTDAALAEGIISYSQPVKEMAAASFKALAAQRKLGTAWKARQYRFKGELRLP